MGFYKTCIIPAVLHTDFIEYALSRGCAVAFYRICIISEALQWNLIKHALSLWFCIWIL